MPADPILVHLETTPFEERILFLALEEEGLDPDDPDALKELVLETSRRVIARREQPRRGETELPMPRDRFDELVLLCFGRARCQPCSHRP